MNLFSRFWGIVNARGHARIFNEYTGVELSGKKDSECVLRPCTGKATLHINGVYRCTSNLCIAKRGLDLPRLMANVTGESQIEVVQKVVKNH